MKIQTLAVAAGVSVPLILTGSVEAGFTGISTTSKPNPFGLLVVNVYAIFDRPGEDHMIAVTGTPNAPMLIEVIGGQFFQSPFGTDRSPNPAVFEFVPSLRYDTFVTIGVKSFNPADPGFPEGQPEDNLVLNPAWSGFGASTLESTTDRWAITPNDAQGNPFDAVNSFPGNGQVLIGQFSTANGTSIQGTMLMQYISNGVSEISVVSFFHVPSPGALAMMSVAGLIGTRRRRR